MAGIYSTTGHPEYVVDPTVPIRFRGLSMFVEGIRCNSCGDPLQRGEWPQWRCNPFAPLVRGYYCPFCASTMIAAGRAIFIPWAGN